MDNKLTSREIIVKAITSMVKSKSLCYEKLNEGEWLFRNIDDGKSKQDYVVKHYYITGTKGQQINKRELYRLVDGCEQKVELGNLKKEYLYKIIKKLSSKRKYLMNDCSKFDLEKFKDCIRENRKCLHIDEKGSLVGNMKEYGQIELVNGYDKKMKKDHNRILGRKLYINGQLVFEGNGLNGCFSCFNDRRVKQL